MKRQLLLLGVAVMLLLAVTSASAQSGGGYDLAWNTIDNGGGESDGTGYALNGTIGQPDAGALYGGGYTLSGGFWIGGANQYQVYLPVVVK